MNEKNFNINKNNSIGKYIVPSFSVLRNDISKSLKATFLLVDVLDVSNSNLLLN